MARPSKKQLAEKKQAKAAVRRAAALDLFWVKLDSSCYAEAEDEFLVRCEGCGQEQLAKNPACIVCRCGMAVFSAAIESKHVFALPDEPRQVRALAR